MRILGAVISVLFVFFLFLELISDCASSDNEDSGSCIEQTDESASVQPETVYGDNVCYAFEA